MEQFLRERRFMVIDQAFYNQLVEFLNNCEPKFEENGNRYYGDRFKILFLASVLNDILIRDTRHDFAIIIFDLYTEDSQHPVTKYVTNLGNKVVEAPEEFEQLSYKFKFGERIIDKTVGEIFDLPIHTKSAK